MLSCFINVIVLERQEIILLGSKVYLYSDYRKGEFTFLSAVGCATRLHHEFSFVCPYIHEQISDSSTFGVTDVSKHIPL
jgi:hypothetical protein